jgi:hypothetical protein
MKRVMILLLLTGCAELPWQSPPPPPPKPPTAEELIQERRNDYAAARLKLAGVQSQDAPDYDVRRSTVQLKELELEEAKAKAIHEQVLAGQKFKPLGTSIVFSPWLATAPWAVVFLGIFAGGVVALKPKERSDGE